MTLKTITKTVSILLVTLGMVSYAGAAAHMNSDKNMEPAKTAITAKYAEGLDVESSNGTELGTLDDMLVDLQSGEIKYYLVNTGFLGIGGATKAVPAKDFTHTFNKSSKFIYNGSEESFDELHPYHESMTAAENAQVLMGATSKMMHDPKRMALAMEVLNENVYASEGDRIGKADNWVINPADDTIAYIIVRNIRFGTPTGPDHDYYLIQANEVEKIDRHDSDIHVAVPSNALNEAPSVSQTDMVDTMQRNDTLVFRYEPAS